MRCSWKFEWILAITLLGLFAAAGRADEDATLEAEEATPAAHVEPSSNNKTIATSQQSPKPSLAQPIPTAKPAAKTNAKATSKTPPASKAESGPELGQPHPKAAESPGKSKPVARSATTGSDTPAKEPAAETLSTKTSSTQALTSKALTTKGSSTKTMSTPEVRELPSQPSTMSSRSAAEKTVAGNRGAAPPRSATPRSALETTPRVASETAAGTSVPTTRTAGRPSLSPAAAAAARTAAPKSPSASPTGSRRATTEPPAANRVHRPVRTTSNLPSRSTEEEPAEVQNADYQELGSPPHVMTEPPARVRPHSRGWHMAALQPAAPRNASALGDGGDRGQARRADHRGHPG